MFFIVTPKPFTSAIVLSPTSRMSDAIGPQFNKPPRGPANRHPDPHADNKSPL
jgi:hypothetical protein